jgi:hypothetical protein
MFRSTQRQTALRLEFWVAVADGVTSAVVAHLSGAGNAARSIVFHATPIAPRRDVMLFVSQFPEAGAQAMKRKPYDKPVLVRQGSLQRVAAGETQLSPPPST